MVPRNRFPILLSLLLTSIPVIVAAPAAAQEFSGGIRADLALASLRNEDVEQSRRAGIRVGVFGDLALSGPVDLHGEIVYANKGSRSESSDRTLELDYIEVPIAAKVALGASPIHVLAGPTFAFLVNSPFGDSDLVNSFEFGLMGGFGFDATLGTVPVTFDIRYATGLTAIFDFGPDDSDSDDRNQLISLGMGVTLF